MMSPARRSVLLAAIGGMMAAAYLNSEGIVDLSLGFPPGSLVEGLAMVVSGALAGVAVLFVFRTLRGLVSRDRE